jgi:hypothetical protein
LFGVADGIEEVDVGGFVVLYEMLFCVFDDAVGAEGHEAVHVAAEVGEELSGVVGAEDFFDLLVLGEGGLLGSRHNR